AAAPLIDLIYGSRWTAAAPMLSLLALAGTVWPINVLNLAALNAQGRSDRLFRLQVLKRSLIIIATLIAARWGAIAVAAAMLIASAFSMGANTWYTHRMLGYGLLAQLYEQWQTIALASIAAVPAWAVLHWTSASAIHTVLAVLSAIAVYVGLAAATRPPAWTELLGVLRTLARTRS